MSLQRVHSAIAKIPPGDPDGAWLRDRIAFFAVARKHGISLERALEIEPIGRAARSRRDRLLTRLHQEFFPTLSPSAAEKRISQQIRKSSRRNIPDGTPMGEKVQELLNLGLPLGSRTILRSLENSMTNKVVDLSRDLSEDYHHEIAPPTS